MSLLRSLSSRFGLGDDLSLGSFSNHNPRRGSRTKRRGLRPGGRSSRAALYDEYESERNNYEESDGDIFESVIEEVIDDDDDDDASSVYTAITVETVRTVDNENTKPDSSTAAAGQIQSTQIFVGSKHPTRDLKSALSGARKASIFMKEVRVTADVAAKFYQLIRGENRGWESIAADVLRQGPRWESIVFDQCSSDGGSGDDLDGSGLDTDLDTVIEIGGKGGGDEGTGANKASIDYFDLILSSIVNNDNCAYLHLSNFAWTVTTSFAVQPIAFSKNLSKLQLDFVMELPKHIHLLVDAMGRNKSITCLITSRCGLEDDHLGALLSKLPPRLEELRIFGNKCRAKGLAALTDHLQDRKKCRLKILDMSFQHVQPDEEFDITWFSYALGGNKTLKTLDLDNDSLEDSHLTHIVTALCRNKTLEEIMLNHNRITDAGVAMLAAKFGEMKGLKKISMYSNVFDGKGGAASAAANAAANGESGAAPSENKVKENGHGH